jgi:hypothetical protein
MSNVFETDDPRGLHIFCTDDRWQNHILVARPWMRGWEADVREALLHPKWICSDADFDDRNNYYYFPGKKGRYLKVVIRLRSKLLGEVVTAYPSDSGKAGERILWMPSSD